MASLALVTACKSSTTSPVRDHPAATSSASVASTATHTTALPFIHDDWPRALREAKAAHKLVFVDAWAPWCHTCKSLETYVFTDPSLAEIATDFVWLAIDTEREDNAPFVSKFPSRALPTLWVFDAEIERPLMQWEGAATAAELKTLLAATKSGGAGADAMSSFVRGNRAIAAGNDAEAERELRAALASAPPSHPYRAQIVEALSGLLMRTGKHAPCIEVALSESPALPASTSKATAVWAGLQCAVTASRTDDVTKLVTVALAIAESPAPGVMADDRSSLFEAVVDARKSAGDAAGAKAAAATWAAFLEGEAAKATTPAGRAVFDPHRLGAYLALGTPERAVPMLQATERDFPDDYNPSARLAMAYKEMGRFDDATRAIERAASRVYGPRSLRVFMIAADIAQAKGDKAAERSALERGLAKTEGLTLSTGQRAAREKLASRLAALGADRPRDQGRK